MFNAKPNKSIRYRVTKLNELELKPPKGNQDYVYCGTVEKNGLVIKKTSYITMDGSDVGEMKFVFVKTP